MGLISTTVADVTVEPITKDNKIAAQAIPTLIFPMIFLLVASVPRIDADIGVFCKDRAHVVTATWRAWGCNELQ